jgi:hypothetical protein
MDLRAQTKNRSRKTLSYYSTHLPGYTGKPTFFNKYYYSLKSKTMFDKSSMRYIGLILFILGSIIIYSINRKRFNRRTITGMEVFNSYEDSLTTRGGEGCLKIAAWGFILGGGSMILLSLD